MTHEQDTAKKIIGLLNTGADTLDQATADQLAAARKQAVAAARSHVGVSSSGEMLAGMGEFFAHLHFQRSWVLLAVGLMLTFFLIQQYSHEPVEGDALLLASDLPPEAYVDKGFDAWLEQSSQL